MKKIWKIFRIKVTIRDNMDACNKFACEMKGGR